mgnify:CR=1 FL=1|jgi:hypothetical protein
MLLHILENVFYIFAIIMLIIGILIAISVIAIAVFIIMSVFVNGIVEDKENNNL